MANRPSINRPIASYLLSRWLEQHGYTCQVIEFVHLFSGEELAEYTSYFISDDTLYIGVSTTMWSQHNEAMRRRSASSELPDNVSDAMDILRIKYPNVKFVVGGPATRTHSDTLHKFDFIIDDQYAEDTTLKLTDKLAGVFKLRQPFNFDTFKFNWKKHDVLFPEESVPIEMSRGCIFACSFCRDPLTGKKPGTYQREYDLLREEFIYNHEQFGIRRYTFICETFNDDPDRVFMMERLAQSLPFELEWISWFRLDLLAKNPETIPAIANSGCRGAIFGIETFHHKAAKAIKKTWIADNGKVWIKKIVDAWKDRVRVHPLFIAGLPYEPEDSIRKTMEWVATESGVYAWSLYPLCIGKASGVSLFEDRPDLYGLKFKEYNSDRTPKLKTNNDWWSHDIMDYDDALRIAGELNRHYFHLNKPTVFGLPASWTIGKTSEEYENLRKNRLDPNYVDNWWQLEERFFNNYKIKLLTQRNKHEI